MKKIMLMTLVVGLILTFNLTVFAKDCPKKLGYIEVEKLKSTCFYKEYDKNGNLTVFGNFKNGKKKGVWEWTSYYFKNKDWKNNRHYADVKNDFEYIERSLNQEYTVQKQGDKQIKISISTNKEQKKDKKFQNANNQQ